MKSELLKNTEMVSHLTLIVMAAVYMLRIFWLLKFKSRNELQAPTGRRGTSSRRGILFSLMLIFMPWVMESSRKNIFRYLEFVMLHLGIAAVIVFSFIFSYALPLVENLVFRYCFIVLAWGAFVAGMIRVIRRLSSRTNRAVSTPDDYFSICTLIIWLFFAGLAALYPSGSGEWHLITYYGLTAFLILYVPFSKISHYLYYPFTMYYFGKTMGRRGVYPFKRSR